MKKALFRQVLSLGCVLLAIMLSASWAWAKPTTPEQARRVVQNWLSREATPLGARLGRQIREVKTFNGETSTPAYYVIYLNPSGLVFLPADDLVEPIIGFVSEATSFDPSPKNPLGALVSRDIPVRVMEAQKTEAQARKELMPLAPESHWAKAQRKWERLANPAAGLDAYWPGFGPTDIRVAPLVQSKWNQGGSDGSYPPECNNPCYNYYTPPNVPGNPYNYVCGCPATAMSQLLRYWQYPVAPVFGTFNITINGFSSTRPIRGGSLSGGGYDWDNMVLDPADSGANSTQCQAIGALTADAGVSVNTDYGQDSSGVKDIASLVPALINTFRYSNAICGSTDLPQSWTNIPLPTLYSMINPNLDAQYPVLFAIASNTGGHVIVGDGYGYTASTIYHHLNMGWSGSNDAWYNLPDMYTSNGFYGVLDQCIYNVYKTGTGEIISGRVKDSAGNPLSGVTLTATVGSQTYPAMQKDVVAPTTGSGVYAIPKVPSNTSFNVTASKPGYTFTPIPVTTGTSVTATYFDNPSIVTGNKWGIDFVGTKVGGKIAGLLPLLLD